MKKFYFQKKDFISEYKILKNSEPKMGCKVEKLGLNENVSNYLKELKIKQFYKFSRRCNSRNSIWRERHN